MSLLKVLFAMSLIFAPILLSFKGVYSGSLMELFQIYLLGPNKTANAFANTNFYLFSSVWAFVNMVFIHMWSS